MVVSGGEWWAVRVRRARLLQLLDPLLVLLVQLLRQPLRLSRARRLLPSEGGARLGEHLLVLLDRLLLPPQLRLQRAVRLGREESDALVAALRLDGGGGGAERVGLAQGVGGGELGGLELRQERVLPLQVGGRRKGVR